MSDQPKPWENRLIGLVHVFGETQPDTEGRTQVMQRILRLVEDELRRQHSRIEADEALMRQAENALDLLTDESMVAMTDETMATDQSVSAWNDACLAITALRTRLERSNG